MADVLLGIVIENLGSLIREELATFLGVDELTQKLSRNLTAIRAVLQDAEEKRITSHAVKVWLQNLADAAHVLDDILDECSITSKAYGGNKWINRFHPKKILASRGIGKRMKAIAEKIDAIAAEGQKYELRVGVTEEHQRQDDEWRQTISAITEPEVYGRDRDRKQVVEFLLRQAVDSEELSVYSIVGVGEQGKTTLAQVVFNDERVNTHFDMKIWVCVSDDFSMMTILKSIIESAIRKNPDLSSLESSNGKNPVLSSSESMQKEGRELLLNKRYLISIGNNPGLSSLESMQEVVREILRNKRYLLILDDVWSEDQEKWNKFKYLLQRGNGTKGSILVTTRLDTVASIMGTYPAHHLGGLSDDDIWSLFKQQAFGTNREERAELVAIGKEIVKKCVGSPLAAKVLGSLLQIKSEEHQWISIKESNLLNLSDDNRNNRIMSVLRLSYFHLKLSLRPCFTFCAVFPKGFEMMKEQLIHLWMANGFISSRGNLDAEQVGQEVWNELYSLSFFQEVKTDEKGNVTFKMHDLFHDLAQSIMGKECVASGAASLTNLSSRVHHISCSFTKFDKPFDYNTIPFKKFESLRTFLELDMVPLRRSGSFPSLTPLRALRTRSLQLSALKGLTHLRYLELFESYIKSLPRSICKLQNLQILKLNICPNLTSLPNQLTQLQDLRHLVIKHCTKLASMPSNISKLTCLKTLSTFIVGSKMGLGLAELRDLQLGGKLHIKGLQNVSSEWDAKEANLKGKKELNRLYLSWDIYAKSQDHTNVEQVLEVLEPPTGLKGFGMNGYLGIHLPHWMRNTSFLEGLVDVILYNCKNCQRLPPLGKLPCLTTLYVSGIRDVKYIDDDVYESTSERAFVSLKILTLRSLPNLEQMLKAEGVKMLPQLSYLRISNVPKLALPSLPSLEIIETGGLNNEFIYNFSENRSNEFMDSFDYSKRMGFLFNFSKYGFKEFEDLFPTEVVSNMHNLKSLFIIHFTKLKVLPDDLHSLSALEELEISLCDELESFSMHALQGLVSLRTLTIDSCPNLISLSEGMGDLGCLEKLLILDCPRLALPSNMNKLTSLRQVVIGYCSNGSSKILQGIEVIPSLQILTLAHVNDLPESLGAMTSLQRLTIIYCPNVKSLPNSFPNLINLHTLNIFESPMLEKRCKKGTGEDWKKIAHVSKLQLDSKETSRFSDHEFEKWKMGSHLLHRKENYIYAASCGDFDRIVSGF